MAYGFSLYNANGSLIMSDTDIAALYKASYSGSTTATSASVTINISASGVLTTDLAFVENLEIDEIQKVSIPSNGTIRYETTNIDPPSTWTAIYKITVISKGDQ